MSRPQNSAPSCDCEVIHEQVVERVKQGLTPIETSSKLANLFKLFADRTRVRLLQCLLLQEMCVCDLAVTLNVSKSAVSHHLSSLKLSNIVRFLMDGQIVFYSLADDHVAEILSKGLEHILE